jgi:pimeloyl-ACP methyl ester carboxylesterase
LAYAAAVRYRAAERINSCLVPVTVIAREDDLLFSHLERLPEDFPRHAIKKLTPDRTLWVEAVALWCAQNASAAAPEPVRQTGALRFVHDAHGELLLHSQGSGGERPLIFLHNQPGSSRTARPLTRLVEQRRQVLTFDLPGSGESSAGGDLSARLLAAIDTLGIETFDVAGEFTGRSRRPNWRRAPATAAQN